MKHEKYNGSEKNFQKICARYLDLLGVVWCHPPNEIKAKPQYMKERKLMGVKSGVPDIIIFNTNTKYNGLAIELKVGYNKMSDSQLKWNEDLTKLGWLCICTHSFDEFKEIINNYLKK